MLFLVIKKDSGGIIENIFFSIIFFINLSTSDPDIYTVKVLNKYRCCKC